MSSCLHEVFAKLNRPPPAGLPPRKLLTDSPVDSVLVIPAPVDRVGEVGA